MDYYESFVIKLKQANLIPPKVPRLVFAVVVTVHGFTDKLVLCVAAGSAASTEILQVRLKTLN